MNRQPPPIPNQHPSIPGLVVDDLNERTYLGRHRHTVAVRVLERQQAGIATYGTSLQPYNGRDALQDLDDELVDATQYARQLIAETVGTSPTNPHTARLLSLYDDLLHMCCAVADMRAERTEAARKDTIL